MKNSDIIKGLECCNENGDCSKCPYESLKYNTNRDCVSELHYDTINLFINLKIENLSLSIFNQLIKGVNSESR